MKEVITALIIEAKQGMYDNVRTYLVSYAEAMREAVNEPGLDNEGKDIIKAKEDLLWELLDGLDIVHQNAVEMVKENHGCYTDTSAYLQTLKNWTQSC